MVAIYDARSRPRRSMQNFLAGAAQRFTLRFGLDATLGAGA